jgi:drug/metabolite transporter (DMT)-like permease
MKGAKGRASIWKVHAVLAIIQCSYALYNILCKVAFSGGINPIVFTVFRDSFGASSLALMSLCTEREPLTLPDWKTGGLIVLLGFSGMYGSQLTMGFGQSLAPASYSCLIGITVPIFVFIISVASGLEKVKWTRWSGLAKVAGVLSAVCGGILIPLYNGPVVISRLVHAIPLPELPLDVRGVLASSFSSLNVGDDAIGGFLLVLCGFLQALYWTFQVNANCSIVPLKPQNHSLFYSLCFCAVSNHCLVYSLCFCMNHSLVYSLCFCTLFLHCH